jgi:hypothetical protein
MSTLTVSYRDPHVDPTVFLHVDRMIRDDGLIWLEFKALPGFPSGAGAVLQTASVKEIKMSEEE